MFETLLSRENASLRIGGVITGQSLLAPSDSAACSKILCNCVLQISTLCVLTRTASVVVFDYI